MAQLRAPEGRSGNTSAEDAKQGTASPAEGEYKLATTYQPMIVGPVHTFAVDSLWDMMSKKRQQSSNVTGLWKLDQAEGDLQLSPVRAFNPNETVWMLPVYTTHDGKDMDREPELVQVAFSPKEATLKQLMQQPDELLRTLPKDITGDIPATKATSVAVEHAGDVTVTGSLTESCGSKMSDADLETLVYSLLRQELMASERSALADMVERHWTAEGDIWSPSHVSVVTAHRCELVPHVELASLLRLGLPAVAAVVQRCQNVWQQSSSADSLLGRYARVWLQKISGPWGSIDKWSPVELSESMPLLEGALPEEIARMSASLQRNASAPLSFAKLNRVQAQPVLERLLDRSSDMTEVTRLHELARHLQPNHVRSLLSLIHQFLSMTDWMLADSNVEEKPFATHLQLRLLLDPIPDPNMTEQIVSQVGKFFYTLPLHKVYDLHNQPGVNISAEFLRNISSPHLESMTRRLLMSMFMLAEDRLCEGCMHGVPPEILGSMADASLTALRLRGRLYTPQTVSEFIPAAKYMLDGKRADLLSIVRLILPEGHTSGTQSAAPVLVGVEELWSLATPADLPRLVPVLLARMSLMAKNSTSDQLIEMVAHYPTSLLSAVLAYYRQIQPNGTWTAETLLGRRPGLGRPTHGPWLYLAGLSCADVEAVTPLDIAPVAEQYEAMLEKVAAARGEPGAALMPLRVCVCLQRQLIMYLKVRHAMTKAVRMPDARAQLRLSSLRSGLLHQLTGAEVRSVPACVLVLLPRHYLSTLPRDLQLLAYQKIGRLTWHQIMNHIAVQQNEDKFAWFGSELLHLLNATGNVTLGFEQIAQLNQLLHFVNGSVIARIEPAAFREWIYTLRNGGERLVCDPDPAWEPLILAAFGEDPAQWNMSTPFYLGGWLFALNSTLRDAVRKDHLRYVVDYHNAVLFRKLPDVLGGDSQQSTFMEACLFKSGFTPDLRLLFDAARVTGVVGYPRPRARRSENVRAQLEAVAEPEENVKQLNTSLFEAVATSNISDKAKEFVGEFVNEFIHLMENNETAESEESKDRSLFEFGPSDGRLQCADLRAAGPAAAAVTTAELEVMSQDVLDMWSCLNTLGELDWRLAGGSATAVWPVARRVNGPLLGPDNMAHFGDLVTALTPEELARLSIAAGDGVPPSSDAISLLGRQRWSPEQLSVLIAVTLGISDDANTSRLRVYSTPAYITALGNLLCGFSADQIRTVFNGTQLYRDTSTAVGRLTGCATDGPLETLAELAVKTYGPTHGWTETTVAAVGSAVAGLRRWQLAALPKHSLRGLSTYAARRISAGMLAAGMTSAQLRHVPPPAARELLSQPGLTKEQQDALQQALHGSRSARAAPEEPHHISTNDTDPEDPTGGEPQTEPEPSGDATNSTVPEASDDAIDSDQGESQASRDAGSSAPPPVSQQYYSTLVMFVIVGMVIPAAA